MDKYYPFSANFLAMNAYSNRKEKKGGQAFILHSPLIFVKQMGLFKTAIDCLTFSGTTPPIQGSG